MSGVIRSKLHIVYVLILFLVICLGLVVLLSRSARAVEGSTVWSWSGNKQAGILFTGNVPTLANFQYCPTYYLPKNTDNPRANVQMCMLGDGKLKVGNYYLNTYNFRGFKYTVGLPGDTTMYDLRGLECYSYDGCLYVPEKDMLVSKEYLINGLVRSLVIYKDFSKRITRRYDSLTDSRYFFFDTSVKDYVFQSTDGYPWPINGAGASDNGDWLGVEFRGRGFGLLNLDTFEWKRVSRSSMSYGYGLDALPQIAVSNDGAHMIITGINSGLEFIDITPDCGESVADLIPVHKTYSRLCKRIYLPIDKVIDGNRFSSGYAPRFNEDGSQVRLYLESSIPERKEVVFGAPDKVVTSLDYLALGDSYTSGEGETSDSFYQPYTNDEYEKCHLSTRSYPYLLAGLFNIDPGRVKSVACSGAKTEDIVGEDGGYAGQRGQLGPDGFNLDKPTRVYYQTYARENFIPGRTHQENFLSTNLPKIVTIGIGGNDVGFMEKLANCVSPGTCAWASTSKAKEQSGVEIKKLFPRLVDTYVQLHNKSPGSYIYAVGYPSAINITGECGFINNLLLSKDERIFMDEGIKYLNQIIQAAARTAGIGYIDVSDSYGEQTLCGRKQPAAMNAVRLGGDIGIFIVKFIGSESFHPTPVGHALTAAKIAQKYPTLFNPNYCGISLATICPEAIGAPALSDYWVDGGVEHGYPEQRNVDYVVNKQIGNTVSKVGVEVPDNSFEPNSLVKIEVHSETYALGDFITSATGGLQAQLTLPQNLPEGYHSIHIMGRSLAGDEIDIYDFLQIGQNVPEVAVDNSSTTAPTKSAVANQPTSNVEPAKNDNKIAEDSNETVGILGQRNQKSLPSETKSPLVSQKSESAERSISWLWALLPTAGAGLWLVLRSRRRPV